MEWTPEPSQLFLASCKSGDIPSLRNYLDQGGPQPPIDVNVRGLFFAKGRLLGIKSFGPHHYIFSHSSQERMQGTGVLFAAVGLKPDAFGYLMARGGDPRMKCGMPPHLPHEPDGTALLNQHLIDGTSSSTEESLKAQHMLRLISFFNVWKQVPFESEKKVTMLEKGVLGESICDNLRKEVVAYLQDVRSGKVKPYVLPPEGDSYVLPEHANMKEVLRNMDE